MPRSEGHSKQIVIGENKGVVNTGDTYEVQREVLALGIERWRPQLDPEEWVDRGQPQTELQRRIADPAEPLVEVVAAGALANRYWRPGPMTKAAHNSLNPSG
jgi:hypothetical protein